MYESHFGFSGTPFNLNPDPEFYFQSKGHGNALSYLRFGVYQGEGFVVVTGEIGAGKTTLVRTMLSELDDQKIVAAQIVSTQLEAGDLLRSVAIAFGVAPKNLSKAELIASIEAFLTLLVTQNKRALLVVDEAQNLNLQAIEELRMLSNFQLGNHALLQSFLVGQPELRQLLTSKPMEQFRQRVIASCHLGPMDADETRAYVEHRLKKVGWAGTPSFDPAAFERIHHWATGTPRRVNLLCNRLLLSAYLASSSTIDASDVDVIAGEVLAEVGESKAHLSPMLVPAHADSVHAASGDHQPAGQGHPGSQRNHDRLATQEIGPVLCIAASRADDVKIAALMLALQRRDDSPCVTLVRIGDSAVFAPNDEFHSQIGVETPVVDIAVSEATAAGRIAKVILAFESLCELHAPSAIVVVGNSDAALACGIVASKRSCPLVHGDIALRTARASVDVNALLLERLAIDLGAQEAKRDEGMLTGAPAPVPVGAVDSLAVDAVQLARARRVTSATVLSQASAPLRAMVERQGHALVILEDLIAVGDRRQLTALLSELREASNVVPLVWPMHRATATRLEAFGLRTLLKSERIAVLGPIGYPEFISLMDASRCVLTDSNDVRAEAHALGVPCLSMNEAEAAGEGAPGRGDPDTTAYSRQAIEACARSARPAPASRADASDAAADRLAEMLIAWLARRGLRVTPLHRQLGS